MGSTAVECTDCTRQDLAAAAQEKRQRHMASRPGGLTDSGLESGVDPVRPSIPTAGCQAAKPVAGQFTTCRHLRTATPNQPALNQQHHLLQQLHTTMEAPQFNTTSNIDYMDDSDSMLVRGIWSEEEHERFLEAMKMYPLGPWRTIADHVRTRSIKQVQTHAQKYQQKVARRQRGLRKQKKRVARPEHRVDQAAAGFIVRKAIERSTEAPGSPTSFEEMLFQATPAVEEPQVRLDAALDTIEPLPFSYCSSSDPFGYATEVHHKDLEDSLILFLASV